MRIKRIVEYLEESSNQSRFVLALSLSTVMALIVTLPLAVKAVNANNKEFGKNEAASQSTLIMFDFQGNSYVVPVPQAKDKPKPTVGSKDSGEPDSEPAVDGTETANTGAAQDTSSTEEIYIVKIPSTTQLVPKPDLPLAPKVTTNSTTNTTTPKPDQPTTTRVSNTSSNTATTATKPTTTVAETEPTDVTTTTIVPEPTLSETTQKILK